MIQWQSPDDHLCHTCTSLLKSCSNTSIYLSIETVAITDVVLSEEKRRPKRGTQPLHSTLYTPHSPLHTPYSTFHALHFTLHTLHSTLHTLHFTLHTPHFTLHTPHTLHFRLHTPLFTLYTLHFTLHTLHPTLYTLYSTLYTAHFTLDTLHSTLHTLHSTLFRIPQSTVHWYGNREKCTRLKTVQIICFTKAFYVTAFGFGGHPIFRHAHKPPGLFKGRACDAFVYYFQAKLYLVYVEASHFSR